MSRAAVVGFFALILTAASVHTHTRTNPSATPIVRDGNGQPNGSTMFADLKFCVCLNILKFGEKWTHAPHAIKILRMMGFFATVPGNSALYINPIKLVFVMKFRMLGICMHIWAENVPKT